MVYNKPNVTFGGVPPTAPSTPRSRGSRAGARGAESFASYLPVPEPGTQGKTSPVGPAAAPAQQAAEKKTAPAAHVRGADRQGNARMYLGFLPDNYVPGSMQDFPGKGAGTAPVNLPPGNPQRTEARALARPGAQGMTETFPLNAAIQQRISPKSGIRLSGVPVTGRGNIGMVDTRKAAPGITGLAHRGGMLYAPPQTEAAHVRGMPQGGTLAPPGSDAFTSFSAYYGGERKSPNSFVEQGFSSKNAQLAMRKLGIDPQKQPKVRTYARQLDSDAAVQQFGDGEGPRYGSTRPVRFASGEDGARMALLTENHRKRAEAQATNHRGTSLVPDFQAMANRELGTLAAKFESGEEGIAAIGYDRKGGTSYGKYQIASRVGTMRAFLTYLHDKAPDLAKRLEAAGPANTGGRNGRMPTEWRKIAAEDPARFEALQSDFIRTSHFEPAKQAIAASTGVSFERMPPALQEVLFSTAVQHGPAGATRIVNQALKQVDAGKLQSNTGRADRNFLKTGEQLINHIYNLRAGQFLSSTSRVQSAVRSRLKQEMREALQMLS